MSDTYDIDEILSEIVTLPSLPGTIMRVREMLDDPECSLSDVGEVISTDPAIALKALRLVNSAQYGTRNPVKSVEQAVALLGAKVVRNLVLSAAVFDQLRGSSEAFIRHSICCGMAMEMLVDACPKVALEPDEAFVYGVLHDIGVIIFKEFLPEQHKRACRQAQREGIPLYVAERQVIGVDHASLGGRLARHWRLPVQLSDAVAGHHDMTQVIEPENRPIAALLAAADFVCHASGIASGDFVTPMLSDEMVAQMGIAQADIPAVLDRFYAALPNVDELVETVLV